MPNEKPGRSPVLDTKRLPNTAWPDKPTGVATSPDFLSSSADFSQRIPQIVVYEDIDFGGEAWPTSASYLYVGDHWNDRISSIFVVSGRWRFYLHRDYQGPYWDLGPGSYRYVQLVGIPNDTISSWQYIGG